jgi:hypothetical protein
MIAVPNKLPRGIAAITPEWLTSILAERYPEIKVTQASLDGVIASTATKARFRLGYRGGSSLELPAVMILKGGLYGHPHEEHLVPLYRNEAVFYRDVAPCSRSNSRRSSIPTPMKRPAWC